MSTSSKFNPPKFIDSGAGYAEYKRKLERWSRITKHELKKQAEVVLYHLEGHPSGIQEKIDTALGDEIIDKDDGLQKLIKYLDGIYAEDEMTEAWHKYKQFIRLRKSPNQTITEFIAEFDKSYQKAKEYGNECSDTTLAFNLLEACDLSDTDEKFVLTAVNFKEGKEKKDLLTQVKNSLRKFQGRNAFNNTPGELNKMVVKQEESFLTGDNIESLIAAGWKPPAQPGYQGRKNPLGRDGKPLKCFFCGSIFHMKDKCDKKNEKKEEDNSKESKESSNRTVKTKPSKKATRKKTSEAGESAMLSSLLEKVNKKEKEYGMVCVVADLTHEESNIKDTGEPVMLPDLLKKVNLKEEELSLVCVVSEDPHGEEESTNVTGESVMLSTLLEEASKEE